MEKKSLKELQEKVLENKVIKIVPIVRRKPYLKKGHDGEHTFTGCTKGYGLPYDTEMRSYKNPFLNTEEQEIFEILLNQEIGSLNLYNYKITVPNFWGSFVLKVPKGGKSLNLMNPSDALMYRVLLQDPRFTNDEGEKGIVEREYMLVDESAKIEQISALGKKKDKANDYMHKIKKSKADMINTLKLLGKTPGEDSSVEWLKGELYKIIDETTVTRGVSGLDKFLKVCSDPLSDVKLFVLDAIENNEIKRTDMGYKITDTNTFVGRKYEEVVSYFLSKDPAVKETKLIIQERLKN